MLDEERACDSTSTSTRKMEDTGKTLQREEEKTKTVLKTSPLRKCNQELRLCTQKRRKLKDV